MKRITVPPTTIAALLAAGGLTVGVALVFGIGWALIVISGLVLVYIVLPDQAPGGSA